MQRFMVSLVALLSVCSHAYAISECKGEVAQAMQISA
jgi:hypothetical protein